MKILKLFNNIKIDVYDNEIEKILNGIKEKDQIIVLKNGVFNSSSFVAIINEDEEPNRKEGILHDGSIVVRYFGSWYLDGDFDENGKPRRRIDSAYYPEVQRDCVPTKKEFELKYRSLPRKKRLELMIKGTKEPRMGDLKQIGETLGSQVKKLINK